MTLPITGEEDDNLEDDTLLESPTFQPKALRELKERGFKRINDPRKNSMTGEELWKKWVEEFRWYLYEGDRLKEKQQSFKADLSAYYKTKALEAVGEDEVINCGVWKDSETVKHCMKDCQCDKGSRNKMRREIRKRIGGE